jgi:transposase InsO family protein
MMEQRLRFVEAASAEGANRRALCEAFAISPTTGYKWLERYKVSGADGLRDGSRRPHHSPDRTPANLEAAVVEVRKAHPFWGGRKIHHVLRRRGLETVPHKSTVTDILHRHGLISEEASLKHRPFKRFEKETPNELWQMDFKGHFAVGSGRCHPLTVVDDHSRFAVALEACPDERRKTVETPLIQAFEQYGLPGGILIDNGPPWGKDFEHRHTKLTAWLMQLGIEPIHGRPYHPQTRGKNERFNGTLLTEVIAGEEFDDLAAVQDRFDAWCRIYNHERPHEGIGDLVPADRYRPSSRAMPRSLPEIVYDQSCFVRKVTRDGRISFMNRQLFVSNAFAGKPIGLKPTDCDGVFTVMFCSYRVAALDLTGKVDIEP